MIENANDLRAALRQACSQADIRNSGITHHKRQGGSTQFELTNYLLGGRIPIGSVRRGEEQLAAATLLDEIATIRKEQNAQSENRSAQVDRARPRRKAATAA